MLRGWWMISAPFIGNHGTVAERPHPRKTLNTHCSIDLETIVLLRNIQLIEQRVGDVPAVQTTVKLSIREPSVSSTALDVTAFTFVLGRISTPRSASFWLA